MRDQLILETQLKIDDLIESLIWSMEPAELIEFVLRLDAEIADLQFTKYLRKRLKKAIKAEEA